MSPCRHFLLSHWRPAMATRMYAPYGVTDAAWETPPVSDCVVVVLVFLFSHVTRRF